MPGENLIASAAAGWQGPEAVAFGAGAVLLIVLAVVVWKHLGECKRETAAMRAELTALKVEVAGLAALLRPKRSEQ